MDDVLIAGLVTLNGVISLLILWVVAPLYRMRGVIDMMRSTLKSHDVELLNIQERLGKL